MRRRSASAVLAWSSLSCFGLVVIPVLATFVPGVGDRQLDSGSAMGLAYLLAYWLIGWSLLGAGIAVLALVVGFVRSTPIRLALIGLALNSVAPSWIWLSHYFAQR
jgi:hypothetical protein